MGECARHLSAADPDESLRGWDGYPYVRNGYHDANGNPNAARQSDAHAFAQHLSNGYLYASAVAHTAAANADLDAAADVHAAATLSRAIGDE